jgi:hypothetical protein
MRRATSCWLRRATVRLTGRGGTRSWGCARNSRRLLQGRRLGLECSGNGVTLGAAGYRAEVSRDVVRLQADREDAAAVVNALEGGSGASRLLGALAMSLQEDLVLMEQGRDGVPRAVVFHVSFPSAWDPAAKLGQDLLALHSPVADNALLQAAAARLGSALIGKGPFVRWVWTVTTDARWRAWPPQGASEEVEALDATEAPEATQPVEATGSGAIGADRGPPLYFRLERQTTMPLGEGYGLFLIRVQVRALADVLAQEGRLASLQASLQSMSEAMVRYKSLAVPRDRVLSMRDVRPPNSSDAEGG